MKRQRVTYDRVKKRGKYGRYPYGKWSKQFRDRVVAANPKGSAGSKAFWGPTYKEANADQRLARGLGRYKGDGDYKDVLKYASRGVGALSGGALGLMEGGLVGGVLGARGGWDKGADFSRWAGWGDYASGNQIMGGGPQSQISVNRSDMTGDVYVNHTEFVQNVVCSATGAGSSAFQLTKFSLNPGMTQTFPFLSQIAQNFELYDFQGLIFQYKPTSGESGASSNALGKVIFATNYDPTAADFINSIQMSNYDYANSTKPSLPMLHGVETSNKQGTLNNYYVRTAANPSSKSLDFTDLGSLYVGTEGVPFSGAGSQIIGELWVTYQVKLSRANLYNSLVGAAIPCDVYSGTFTNAALWATSTVAKSSNSLALTISNINASQLRITFPTNISLGYYSFTIAALSIDAFDAITQTFALLSNLTNCSAFIPGASLPGGTTNGFTGPASPSVMTDNDRIVATYYIKVAAPGILQAFFDITTAGALPAAGGSQTLIVQQVNGLVAESLA